MRTSRKHVWMALAAAGVAAAGPVASAAIEVAEDLLISLDAASLSDGPLSTWSNSGSLGGSFMNDFLAPNSNVLAGPVGGISRGVIFTGNDALVSDVFSPAGITGVDPTRSIEVWAYNPGVAGEEAMVTWSKRGGPEGTAMQFNFGNNGAFGAATHWGAPDIGWGPAAPAAGTWHHLTYTFDGPTSTTRVYMNGAETNQETLAPGAINTYPGYEFRLGASLAGTEANLEIFASLALARVRVHDGVLTPAQIQNNYNEERAAFVTDPPDPPQARPLRLAPKHRYSFDGVGGSDAVLTDSAGGAHGVLRSLDGVSALNGTGQLSLAGGPSATAGYGDLPNNLVSTLDEVTLEAWITPTGAQNWMRIADFGSTTEGEHLAPGGGGTGADYLFMSATRGTNLNLKRAEIRDVDSFGIVQVNAADANVTTVAGEEQHYALVYSSTSEFGVPEIRLYVDGVLVSSANTEVPLSAIDDVNNWLGRSNYTGDSNFQGLFDEFRIYDYALTSDEILGNFQAGAGIINMASLWAVDAGGNWSAAGNWSGNVPNGAGAGAMLAGIITAQRQVMLDVPVTLGSLRMDGAHRYEIAGPSTLTLDAGAGNGAAQLSAAGPANHLISAPLALASDTTVHVAQPAATLTLANLAATQSRLTKTGSGTVAVNRVRAAGLDVAAGTVRIITGGGEEGVSVLGQLTLAGTTDAWTGTLDLADNDVVLRADAATRDQLLAQVSNQIRHGRNSGTGGRWSGPGITSSVAAGDLLTGLAAVVNPGLETFAGEAVGPDDIIVRYTYNGDANVDGLINFDDYFRIDTGYLEQPANPTYAQGDFNYDGLINFDDYFLIDTAFLEQGDPIMSGMSAAPALASVPEPSAAGAMLILMTLGASRTLATKRRRRR